VNPYSLQNRYIYVNLTFLEENFLLTFGHLIYDFPTPASLEFYQRSENVNLSQKAEIATRTGAVQTATQSASPKIATNKTDESLREFASGEEAEEAGARGPKAKTSSAPKKLTRRETRRRRQAQVELKGTDSAREESARVKSEEVDSSAPTGKKSRVQERQLSPQKGLKTAQNLLHQQSLLAQASIQFEQARGPQPGVSTPFGQQQAMLDSLIRMTEMLYHQHTGDKAGEVFGRPETRRLLGALKGLKNGAIGSGEEASSEMPVPRRSRREFKAQMDRIERVQRALKPMELPADYEPLDLVA